MLSFCFGGKSRSGSKLQLYNCFSALKCNLVDLLYTCHHLSWKTVGEGPALQLYISIIKNIKIALKITKVNTPDYFNPSQLDIRVIITNESQCSSALYFHIFVTYGGAWMVAPNAPERCSTLLSSSCATFCSCMLEKSHYNKTGRVTVVGTDVRIYEHLVACHLHKAA